MTKHTEGALEVAKDHRLLIGNLCHGLCVVLLGGCQSKKDFNCVFVTFRRDFFVSTQVSSFINSSVPSKQFEIYESC